MSRYWMIAVKMRSALPALLVLTFCPPPWLSIAFSKNLRKKLSFIANNKWDSGSLIPHRISFLFFSPILFPLFRGRMEELYCSLDFSSVIFDQLPSPPLSFPGSQTGDYRKNWFDGSYPNLEKVAVKFLIFFFSIHPFLFVDSPSAALNSNFTLFLLISWVSFLFFFFTIRLPISNCLC